MINVTDEEFAELVQRAVADIPSRFARHLDNVAFLTAEEPSRVQLRAGGLLHQRHMTLLGLYEGIPLPARNGGYSGVVPDVITIFARPHREQAGSFEELARDVQQTVWHEVAHYFGLNHGQIRALED